MPHAKLNHSQKREAILGLVAASQSHPTADWIYGQARQTMPEISLATVYRNLNQLVAAGRLQVVQDGRQTRFDANLAGHDHFRCLRCGALLDIHCETTDLAAQAQATLGLQVDRVQVEIHGTCANCLAAYHKGELS